jgi:RNA polymerase sigma-70 factor (ECF subfamily)
MSGSSTALNLVPETDRTPELISAALQDVGRFSELYNKHYLQVYYFVFRRTSDKELTHDLCSVVFLKAMENLKNYKYTGIPFEAWLFRIALNEIYGLHRKKKLDLVYNLDSAKVRNLAMEVEGGEQQERIDQLMQAMEQLEKEEMDLIEMRYFSNLSVKDIACVLNISENNASVRIFRILKKMKSIILNLSSHERI